MVGPYEYTDLVRAIRVWFKYGFGLVLNVKHSYCNWIGGVMVSVRASCTVDRGFKPIGES